VRGILALALPVLRLQALHAVQSLRGVRLKLSDFCGKKGRHPLCHECILLAHRLLSPDLGDWKDVAYGASGDLNRPNLSIMSFLDKRQIHGCAA